MLMLTLFRFAAAAIPWTLNLATWLVARSLNMPEPVVHHTGAFVVAQVQGLPEFLRIPYGAASFAFDVLAILRWVVLGAMSGI